MINESATRGVALETRRKMEETFGDMFETRTGAR